MSTDSWNRLHNRLCTHLRSKEMFYDTATPPERQATSGIFWCASTQNCLGPDEKPVSDEECISDRECYKS